MRKVFLIFAALAFLTACETIQGVGRDVQNAGEALEVALDD
ncbi:MAG: entericidin A/B family lipoprotein [Pseudomonadota bacterium]